MTEDWVKVGAKAAIMRPSRHYGGEFSGYTTVVRLTATQIITARDAESPPVRWRRKDGLQLGGADFYRRESLVSADNPRVWRSLHYQKILDITQKLNAALRDNALLGSDVPRLIVSTEAITLAAMEANKKLRGLFDQEQENRG